MLREEARNNEKLTGINPLIKTLSSARRNVGGGCLRDAVPMEHINLIDTRSWFDVEKYKKDILWLLFFPLYLLSSKLAINHRY